MDHLADLQRDHPFTVVAWSYHHGDDFTPGHADRKAFYNAAKNMGVDVLIDYHNAADLIHERGMKLLVSASASPDDPSVPMGPVHRGMPAVNGPLYDVNVWVAVREEAAKLDAAGQAAEAWRLPFERLGPDVYGNITQLAWYEKHFGEHPAVIGYCINDSCKPCPKNVTAAAWLKTNVPEKIRYVSYGDPRSQAGRLFPVMSFLNWAFTQDAANDRSRHEHFQRVIRTGVQLRAKQGCRVFWPLIPISCPNREVTADEITYQIETAEAAGADGVVLFPFGVKKRGGNRLKQAVKSAAKAALSAAKDKRK